MTYAAPALTPIGTLAPLDPPEPCRSMLMRATFLGGWVVTFWRRDEPHGLRFDATLTAPDGREVYATMLAPTRDRAVESLAGFMAFAAQQSERRLVRVLNALLDVR